MAKEHYAKQATMAGGDKELLKNATITATVGIETSFSAN